ncbi:MAG: MFS transporter [Verrucomicrobiae bacterium]|nr:MFS transporter [Verrucomicrobiae bacterium]
MNIKQDGIAPNAGRLLWAGFMAILAAGVGFGIRGGILANWGAEFGFTAEELGAINGAGFTGFCFGIIIGGVIVDRIGYGKLVIAAFVLHALSALITLGASPEQAKLVAYNLLYWGLFLFAVANGTLEAVANPLVATLFPNNRTHYLNILHASWPAGLVLGGAIGWSLGEKLAWHWKAQLALFLVPTVIYGLMFFGQHMPRSEASQKGLKLGDMFQDVGLLGGLVVCGLVALFIKDAFGPMLTLFTGVDFFSGRAFWWVALGVAGALWALVGVITKGSFGHLLLFALFVAHALVGAVELGTDGWIQNITGNILTPAEGKILFVFTSAIMFALRFCADFLQKKLGLSPVGILLSCAVLAVLGLLLTSRIETFAGAMFALAVYAVGKTFFWPTMLAVVSDRFPRTGAVAMSIMGGIGMMSAGLIGSKGLGYAKDRFAGEALAQSNVAIFEQYKAAEPSRFLFFAPAHGLDGKKLGQAQDQLAQLRKELAATGVKDPKVAFEKLPDEPKTVLKASIVGDRKTLVADAFIPATMAVIYLLILIYFRAIGGYKPVHIVPVETPGARGAHPSGSH